MDEMNSLLEREREALQVMRDRLDDLRTRSRELSNERLQTANAVNALRGRFERADAETDMLRSNVEGYNAELESLYAKKSEAESAARDIQQGMDESRSAITSLEEQRSVREERIESLKADLQGLQARIAELKNDEARLQSRIDVLQSVSQDASDANRSFRSAWMRLPNMRPVSKVPLATCLIPSWSKIRLLQNPLSKHCANRTWARLSWLSFPIRVRLMPARWKGRVL
jgi:chromosome segregation ATPase